MLWMAAAARLIPCTYSFVAGGKLDLFAFLWREVAGVAVEDVGVKIANVGANRIC